VREDDEQMITVQDILEIPGLNLRLCAGKKAISNPVRWVHIAEMSDPTRWLKGGELLLTTGLALVDREAEQLAMLRRLIDANLSGLGFGVGFGFKTVPDSMIALAEQHDFPLFEVPYNIPFIAITEAVASKIVNEQYSLLQRSLAVHEKLTKIVLEEKGLQFIISTLSALVGCSAVLFDFHGLVLCEAAHRRRIPAELIADLWKQISDKRASRQDFAAEAPHGAGGSVQVYPVVASHRIGAFLAVIKDGGEFSDYDRIILHHVVTVTALELVKKKAVAETEKRLAGDFFDELIASDLYEEEIARRLAFFGLEPGAEQLIMLVDIDGFKAFADGARDKEQAVQDVKERLHWAVDEFLAQRDLLFISASHSDAVIVLVQLGQRTPHDVLALAAELQGTIGGMISEVTVSVGIGRPHRLLVDLRQSYYEALYAIQIRKLKGSTSVIASFDDLGSYGLLLGLQDTVSLEVFYDSVLGKLHEYDEANASDLVKSLACFLEANGHWGEAAERLYVHRHTLRYRMKRVEDITGRDLGSSQDRMEFWLALKARELTAQSGKRPRVARPV
jgi:purine catabolism regulator